MEVSLQQASKLLEKAKTDMTVTQAKLTSVSDALARTKHKLNEEVFNFDLSEKARVAGEIVVAQLREKLAKLENFERRILAATSLHSEDGL